MNDLDIDFASFTPESIRTTCEEAIAACDSGIAAIVAVAAAQRTFANTLLALDDATEALGQAGGQQAFMAYVSADDALRERAHEMEEQIDKYGVALSFREDLYGAIREFAETAEAKALKGPEARLLEFALRDYRRNGFDLPEAERGEVRALFDRLVELGVEFRKNIDEYEDAILVTRAELEGLPDAFIDSLTSEEAGGETRYRVSLDYPEIFPFLSNAKSEVRRKELFEKDQRKGGAENVKVLEEAIGVRTAIAEKLGYDSWAAYVVETRMSKERDRVTEFLGDLREKVEAKGAVDMALLLEAKEAAGGSAPVDIWDWRFSHNELMKTKYAVDEFEVAQYFPLDACLEGLFEVTQTLLGLRFEAVPGASTWHADVQTFDVYDTDGTEPFGRFHMDLFPRPSKFGHAAAFTLRGGRRLADGTYQRPISAIVANFTKPTTDQPSLLRHSEVVTLFHEFGHILHQVLTKAPLGRFSGTSTERDFVEAPSQMLEHWCWEADVLNRFARHYETGAPLPEALLASMVAAKNVSSGVTTLRQLYFANLDFTYHSPGFSGDTTAVAEELHPITGFPFTKGTHFQSGFGHLFGYDAGYYGYLWSHVFGDDMYTRFEEAGPLNTEVGGEYRRLVLERGGSVDGDVLVSDFLGREPNMDAFLRGLGLDEA